MNNLYGKFQQAYLNQQKAMIFTLDHAYSFQEIDVIVAKLAHWLFNLGARPGDRIAVQIEKSVYSMCLYLACLRGGFIYLPLNNAYTEAELEYFFTDATPKVIVCESEKASAINCLASAQNSIIKMFTDSQEEGIIKELNNIAAENYPIYPATLDDIAVVLYTSGTTGKPKGAMLSHVSLFHNAEGLNEIWGMTSEDVVLHMLPLFHVHGLFFAVHTAFLAGGAIILLPKFSLELFFEYLPQATVFMGVPTYYTRLLADARLNKISCQRMRLFISGSAPLLPATFIEFQAKTGHTLLERYGMTETGINTSNPLVGERKIGTVGLPLPGVSVRIVNESGQVIARDAIGHIQIKGENLFKSYWGQPDKAKAEFTTDGYFKTGDLGKWDEAGYLAIVGRAKDLIISGGLNIYPKEIESTIDSVAGVIESAVIGVPHPDLGEAVIAIVVTRQGELTTAKLMAEIKKRHAGYKCPKKIFFVTELPKNTLGKIQKNLLRQQFQSA